MPFVHVRSLPFESPLSMSSVVEGITRDFANGTGVGLENVTATWDLVTPGHYAVAGQSASFQPSGTHPVLVDLLVPEFNAAEVIEKMLFVIASSISRRTGVPESNIFINCRTAASAHVFDAGKVERW